MAQQFATGASHVFLGFGSGPQYFGTAESFPNDSRQPEYEMLMNDFSGSKIPLDMAWEGESGQISLAMTRWDEDVANLATLPPFSTSNGSWDFDANGSLMGLEEQAIEIWIVYTFGSALANKSVYVSQGLPPGRHYTQCVLWSPQQDETGTRPMKRNFLFFAWPKPNFITRKFVLYDYDMTGINSSLIT